MGEVLVPSGAKSGSVSAVICRCTCPEGQGQLRHPGAPCPNGILIDLGVVAYHDTNPFKQWAFRIKEWLRCTLKLRPDLKGK